MGGGGLRTGHNFVRKPIDEVPATIFYNFGKAKLVFIYQGNKTRNAATNTSLHYYGHLIAQQSHHTSRIWKTSIFRNEVVSKDVS